MLKAASLISACCKFWREFSCPYLKQVEIVGQSLGQINVHLWKRARYMLYEQYCLFKLCKELQNREINKPPQQQGRHLPRPPCFFTIVHSTCAVPTCKIVSKARPSLPWGSRGYFSLIRYFVSNGDVHGAWHFHDWIDYNGVVFSLGLLEWGRTFSGFGESENSGR